MKLDYSRDELFDELGLKRLKESYMLPGEKSPQERFAYVSNLFGSNPEHAQRLYEYSSKHWLSYSTPILSMGRTKRSLPISCFLVNVADTSEGLVDAWCETAWLSMSGGGVGLGFSIRSSDEKSTGVISHLKTYDSSARAYRQGSTRRGSYAAYLDINHPDIRQFIEIRKQTGDPNMRCMNLHNAVNVSDKFMEIIENCMKDKKYDDSWELIDPHTKEVIETVSAKELWQDILTLRMQTGEPYLHFIDTSNKHIPPWLKDKGFSVKQSNLCSEITLPTDYEHTAVCCLSSVNLEYFDEWKDNDLFLKDVAEMLDNVLTYFDKHAPDTITRAKRSARNERSIGIGALGFHAYLQKNEIPWESVTAIGINRNIFRHIREKLDEANFELGKERGDAPYAEGTGCRFSHMMAIAPNATSSIIMGNTSPSIEPFRANIYRQDTLSGSYVTKNKYLDSLIKKEAENRPSGWYNRIWESITANDGSVQHLEWMEKWDKDVFKTAMEIDQRWIIRLAADRQKYIDQAQSVNLFFRPNSEITYIHGTHFLAWKLGLKTLYYCRSTKLGKADKVSRRIEREIIKEIKQMNLTEGECLACEG